MKNQPYFLHVDMDAFFASVEQLDHPEWKGKPVIVGGLPGEARSVVSTASYEARKFGVHSAMPVFKAYKLCPQGIYTHGRMERYCEISSKIMEILSEYSPDVKQLSIDEACLDITGTELLFGPPEETAKKIQKEIFSKTGLTVSVGLASNPYLAKLSSEMNKPAGFFRILPGDEEKFMLSLPLKKVWGVGKKTLERLNKSGIFTTKDIHSKEKNVLCLMFGESAGSFLYNVVRGKGLEEPKESSHSISNETTFPEDITDSYTAETALLELCQHVMFRLHKEKSTSKTVMVKIRYDDFTTFSIRETGTENVYSTDVFFKKATELFRKKYENGRGIRLLGVGLENVQDESVPQQEVLFDFGSKKQQAVENAILKISEKHPEVKIQKARIMHNAEKKLKSLVILFLLPFLLLKSAHAKEYINQTNQEGAGTLNSANALIPLPKEDSSSIFSYSFGSSVAEFIAQGWWQGEFLGGINATSTKQDGITYGFTSPVFTQQVDLSLYLFLNKQFYFEASFADEFEKNTIALGFYGKEENPLKEVRIAQRGIFFPEGYSSDYLNRSIGQGLEALGIQAHFEEPFKNRWKADFALRYQMQQTFDATFYGKNSVQKTNIPLSSYIKNQFFVLPEKNALISNIKNVYVEYKQGEYKNKNGKRFAKIPESSILIFEQKNFLIISKDALSSIGITSPSKKITIAVSFKNTSETKIQDSIGSYSDENSFLGSVQNLFPKDFLLENRTFSLIDSINDEAVLVLQNTQGFSPFEETRYYDAGYAKKAEFEVRHTETDEKSDDYAAFETDDFSSLTDSSFVNEKHLFVKILEEENTENRYPFSKSNPAIYASSQENTALALQGLTYSPVSNFSIGTNASSSSVKVYKNGILLSGTHYDESSGEVHIPSNVSEYDKIYITWTEDSSDASSGSIASQAGFAYEFKNGFSLDSTIITDWTVSPYAKYAEDKKSQAGYVTFSSGIFFKNDSINITNAAGLTYENPNATGLYHITGFNAAENETLYFGKNSGTYLSEEKNIFVNGTSLESFFNKTVKNSTYENYIEAQKDNLISGYKIPLEWNFLKETQEKQWAAFQFAVSQEDILNAQTFSIAIQDKENLLEDENIFLYVQFGITEEENYDDETKIPSFLLLQTEDKNLSAQQKENGWKTYSTNITDEEKAFFSGTQYGRLVVINEATASSNQKGIIFAGPHEFLKKSLFTKSSSNMNTQSYSEKDNSVPKKNTFNEDDNFVQVIKWQNDGTAIEDSEKEIIAASYFSETDIFSYKTLNFLFKNINAKSLKIILDKNAENLSKTGKEALSVEFSKEALDFLSTLENSWHIMTFNLYSKKILVDDVLIPGENIFYTQKNILPCRFLINFVPNNEKGELYIDELFLEQNDTNFTIQEHFAFSAEKKGILLGSQNFPVLEDAYFSTKNNVSSKKNESEDFFSSPVYDGTVNANLTVMNIKIDLDSSFSSEQKNAITSLSQKLNLNRPIFGIFNASDVFLYNPLDFQKEKQSSFEANFSKIKVPIQFLFEAKSKENTYNFESALLADSSFFIQKKLFSLKLQGSVNALQNEKLNSNKEDFSSYGKSYTSATESSFSMGKSSASSRTVKTKLSAKSEFFPLHIIPELSFESDQKYKKEENATYTDSTSFNFALPVKLKKQQFSFSYKKLGGTKKNTQEGGNYKTDLEELKNSYSEHDWVFTEPPFFDFFDTSLSAKLNESSSEAQNEYSFYSSKYNFFLSRTSFFSRKDFFIPSSFSFSAERSLQTASSVNDNYILKANLINTALNMFGTQSPKPLFLWYETDEHTFSFSSSLKFPHEKPKDNIWNISFYGQSNFYITKENVLKNAFHISTETDKSWNVKETIQFSYEGKNCIIKSAASYFFKEKDFSASKITRTESFDFSLLKNATENKFSQEYSISHKLECKLFSFFSTNINLKGNLKLQEEKTVFIAESSLGLKVTF